MALSRELTALKLGCSGFHVPGTIEFVWAESGPEKAHGSGSTVASGWEGQAVQRPVEEREWVLWAWVEPRDM